MFAADSSECTLLNPFWHLYQTLYKNCFSQTSLSWRHHYLPAAWIFVGAMICKRAWQVMGFGSFWRQTGSKHKSSWNWNLVQPNLSLLGIPLCKISWTALTLRWSNLMWWQSPNVSKTYNVVQTWGLLTAPLSEFANVCSWFIWVHSP